MVHREWKIRSNKCLLKNKLQNIKKLRKPYDRVVSGHWPTKRNFYNSAINEHRETVQIVYARSRETLQSTLSIGVDNRGDPRLTSKEQAAFSTENENLFAEFLPKLKRTGIFIDRFFYGSSYEDLAFKYDMSRETAVKTYHNAVRRLREVITVMDTGETPTKQMDYWNI